MKSFLLSAVLLLAITSKGLAHSQPPITAYVQSSETVCVVQASSINSRIITFSVKEIIKGTPPTTLMLSVVEVPVPVTLNSEWLIASTGAKENTLGWAIDGDCGWVNAPIVRVDGKPFLVGNYGYVDPKAGKDVSKGMSLDQLKELAKEPPTNDLQSISLPIAH